MRQCGHRFARADPASVGRRQCSEQIVSIEATNQWRTHQIGFPLGCQLELHAARRLHEVVGAEVAMHAEAESNERHFAIKLIRKLGAERIIGVDHRHRLFAARISRKRMKPIGLGAEVRIHRAVIIEMILAQVGENAGIKSDRRHALLMNAVRGNFHRHTTAAVVAHAGDQLQKRHRIWRGVRGGRNCFAIVDQHGAEQARAVPFGFHHMMNEKCGGRFSIRAGHSGHREVAPWMARQRRCHFGKRRTAVGHMQPCHRIAKVTRRRGLGKDRRSAG